MKISEIAVINRQRRVVDPAYISELAASIKASGLLHPIVVRMPFPDEEALVGGATYVLMVGGCRLAAHILLGKDEIEARLFADLDATDAEIAELDENLRRRDISFDDEVAARARITELLRRKTSGITDTEIAATIGISKAQLSKDLDLAKQIKADPTLKSATSKGSAIRIATFKASVNQRLAKVTAPTQTDIQAKIVTADAREFLRSLPDQSVDLHFTDFPFGIDYFERGAAGTETLSAYEDSPEDIRKLIYDLIPQMCRTVRPTGWIVLMNSYQMHGFVQDCIRSSCRVHGDYLDDCLAAKRTGCDHLDCEIPPWIWNRSGPGHPGSYPELHAASRYEMIVVANGGKAMLRKKPVANVLNFETMARGSRMHTMQRPHDLCKEIVERCTVTGELVVDVCCGSGSALAAAADLKRDFKGCDINPANHDPAILLVSQYYTKPFSK